MRLKRRKKAAEAAVDAALDAQRRDLDAMTGEGATEVAEVPAVPKAKAKAEPKAKAKAKQTAEEKLASRTCSWCKK